MQKSYNNGILCRHISSQGWLRQRMKGSPRDVGDVVGESSRSDQNFKGLAILSLTLFLCLRSVSGLAPVCTSP